MDSPDGLFEITMVLPGNEETWVQVPAQQEIFKMIGVTKTAFGINNPDYVT